MWKTLPRNGIVVLSTTEQSQRFESCEDSFDNFTNRNNQIFMFYSPLSWICTIFLCERFGNVRYDVQGTRTSFSTSVASKISGLASLSNERFYQVSSPELYSTFSNHSLWFPKVSTKEAEKLKHMPLSLSRSAERQRRLLQYLWRSNKNS